MCAILGSYFIKCDVSVRFLEGIILSVMLVCDVWKDEVSVLY